MVVIVIIAVIASFTFGELNSSSYRLKSTARTMKAHMTQAKLEAVKKGCKVRVSINSTGDGYIVSMLDNSGNAISPPLRTVRYPDKFTFASANNTTFSPQGTANSNSITIVNKNTTEPEYTLSVNNIGRVRIAKTKN